MEFLGVYDETGKELENRKILRGDKTLKDNEYIKLVAVWIKCEGKYLIQKTSKEKGGVFAVSGGHVPYKTTSKQQSIVELQEELGLNLDPNKLKLLGNVKIPHCIFDVFLVEDDSLKQYNFNLLKEEVESVVWCDCKEIDNLIQKGIFRESSKLHYDAFIKNLEYQK